jgi:hypothetical protein
VKRASGISMRFFKYVIILPLLFTVLFTIINFGYFNVNYDPVGDTAATLLRVYQAKKFTETMGPYSRFHYNNIGPIYFYYFALMDNILLFVKSEVGRIYIAQLLINMFFIMWVLSLIYSRVKEKGETIVFFMIFTLFLIHMGADLYFSIWGPNQIFFPMLLFVIAVTYFANGNEKAIIPVVISGIFSMQQHISSLTIILPFCFIAVIVFFIIKKQKKTIVNYKYFYIGIIISILFNIPPLIEQFTSPRGNLTKIFNFILNNKYGKHGFRESINYIASYFSEPFKISFSPIWIMVIMMVIATISIFKLELFHKLLFGFTVSGILFSIYAATNIAKNQYKYIMKFENIFVVLLYYIIFMRIIKMFGKIKLKHLDKLLEISGLIFVIFIVLNYYGLSRRINTNVSKLFNGCNLQKNRKYQIFIKEGSANHYQWPMAVGFVYKMVKEGFEVYVPKEWEFLYGKQLSVYDSINLTRISFRQRSRQIYKHMIKIIHRRSQIEWGELLPLTFPINIVSLSPDDYFDNFTVNLKFNTAFPCAIRIPIGNIPEDCTSLILSLTLDSTETIKLEIILNGKIIDIMDLNPEKTIKLEKKLDKSFFLTNSTNYLSFNTVDSALNYSHKKILIFRKISVSLNE